MLHVFSIGKKGRYVGKKKEISVPPELSVLADGHHNQQVSQDAHQHDQRQEADKSHPLWHTVTIETPKRKNSQQLVQIFRVKLQYVSYRRMMKRRKLLLSACKIKWSRITKK